MTQKWMISPYRDGCTFSTNFSLFCCSPRYGPRPPQEVGRVERGALFWALVAWAGLVLFWKKVCFRPTHSAEHETCSVIVLPQSRRLYVDYSEKTINRQAPKEDDSLANAQRRFRTTPAQPHACSLGKGSSVCHKQTTPNSISPPERQWLALHHGPLPFF